MSEPLLRVLMVEDQQELRELMGQALQDFGIEIHTAVDGPTALELIEQQPDFDVVFSDISMPNGMTGVQLSHHVAKALPNARMILSSGFARSQLEEPLPAHVEFLPKPYRLNQLIKLLKAPATAS